MTGWPTVPGSLVWAVACDDHTPAPYWLIAPDPDEPDASPLWVRPDLVSDAYRQADLDLIEVIHDHGQTGRPRGLVTTLQGQAERLAALAAQVGSGIR